MPGAAGAEEVRNTQMGGRIIKYSKQAEKFLDKQEPKTKRRIIDAVIENRGQVYK